MIWSTSISALQFVGYGTALVGLVYYSLGWEQIMSVTAALLFWLKAVFEPSNSDARLSPALRRILFAVAAVCTAGVLVTGFLYSTGDGATTSVELSSDPSRRLF